MAEVIKKVQIGENVHNIDRVYNVFSASSTAGSTTSGSEKSTRWYVSGIEGITTPYDGMKVAIKIPRAGVTTAGAVFSINGDSANDYHPIAYNINTVFTTHYAVGVIKVFIYDASQKMNCYITAGTSIEVTGVWKGEGDYNTNSTGYLSYTAGEVSSGTTKNYIIGKPTVASSGVNKYNANVYFENDGTLNAPELSEGGELLVNKYQAKLPAYDSTKENYVLSVNDSGELIWKPPYNGEHSNG